MAGSTPSISRRRILGAAAALPFAAVSGRFPEGAPAADPAVWDRRLSRYRRIARSAAEAAESGGWFRRANDRYAQESAAVAARFGSWDAAGECDEGRRLRAAAFTPMSEAEDAYWELCTAPMQRAAVSLAVTAAPDLGAVRVKIAVLRAHELDELDCLARHPLDLVDEDLERLIEEAGLT